MAASALASVSHGAMSEQQVGSVLADFRELEPFAAPATALQAVRAGGVRALPLTNGSAATIAALLDRAGRSGHVERSMSVDEVGRWKPAPEPYLHAAHVCGVRPDQMAMVAAHGWDVHEARRAGLITGWCAGSRGRPPGVFDRADVSGPDLVTVVNALVDAAAEHPDAGVLRLLHDRMRRIRDCLQILVGKDHGGTRERDQVLRHRVDSLFALQGPDNPRRCG